MKVKFESFNFAAGTSRVCEREIDSEKVLAGNALFRRSRQVEAARQFTGIGSPGATQTPRPALGRTGINVEHLPPYVPTHPIKRI